MFVEHIEILSNKCIISKVDQHFWLRIIVDYSVDLDILDCMVNLMLKNLKKLGDFDLWKH
jgi:hypothetical protein